MQRFCLLVFALLISLPTHAEPVSLSNAQWRVRIDPATLAIEVTPIGGVAIQASRGVDRHAVSALKITDSHARWQWDDGAWHVRASLSGRDLSMRIDAREAGELDFLDQPGKAFGRGLVLPLAEGHYVPAKDTQWRDFLLEKFSEFDTSQDLSLPLWGMDYGKLSLHWLLLEPFGNRLKWRKDGDALGLRGRHRFSPLAVDTPLEFILHLGDADPLAGAKRYRQWLIDQGRFEPLSAKIAATPATAKLLGASHVYLWGGGLLAEKDIADWDGLWQVLRSARPLALALVGRFDSEARAVLAQRMPLQPYQKRVLLRALNQALFAQARSAWQTDTPDPQRLAARYGELRDEVDQAFFNALHRDPVQWGGGVSRATIDRLHAAGLRRLWLGLGEGWEPGLWHPEAIQAAVSAGYLIGPYDSYETALATGDNPDWATAHMGEAARERCAIMREDGSLRAGFMGAGYYTDPGCVRPVMERRITAIQRKAGFNSWFLDAYAAGMAFESYRPGATMTYASSVKDYAAASRWIASTLGVPAGSEDGNATTAAGIAFAHGMQTPVIGWGDPDLGQGPRKNRSSPYFLGNYFPPEAPGAFFKPVPAKPLYRHIYFAAPTRLPLYQAVFHDSVVTSHHWSLDNLKLTNVRRENELAQLLYNVPPLFHLSEDTLEQRLPAIRRMDAFFGPLHQRLATQALTGFVWLSEDRLLQETRFADGTVLRANFSGTPRHIAELKIEPFSIVAIEPSGSTTTYETGGLLD
jgi:Glycosyl hydrolases related to GH101 family, GH129